MPVYFCKKLVAIKVIKRALLTLLRALLTYKVKS